MGSSRPLAVVTGGSSGIGFELAKVFAANGFDLLMCAEDAKIAECAAEIARMGCAASGVRIDLAEPGGVERLYDAIVATGRHVEAIAINAGVGVGGDFAAETSLADELAMVRLNVVSTVHLAKLVARDMVARGRGKILITASIAGIMPTPLEAVYGATKAFDLSFAASLHHELADRGVTVTALMPGPTDTNFFRRAGLDDAQVAEEAKKNDPADVARQGFEALMAGKDRVIAASSIGTKIQGATARFVPESVKAAQHKKMSEHGSRKQ